ncbi:MAG: cupin domain-containing protein [Candidatus Delongbacteria bacterium]|nr:cupin domain-containing protein [Candidatus Delongbacteria bacterium]MBN2834523.1 cupin domain-containing protein [Candidatus Delongbacteria bacterium]
MMVKVIKPEEKFLESKNVKNWPIWEKENSVFDWYYDSVEECYILDGEVEVSYNEKTVFISSGDFVIFEKGLECTWKILRPVRKHYNFIN